MSNVNHPSYYNSGKIEVAEAIEDWDLGFHLGNVVKYVARSGKKDPAKDIEDLEKAEWYLKRKIELMKAKRENREVVRPNDMNPREKSFPMSEKIFKEVAIEVLTKEMEKMLDGVLRPTMDSSSATPASTFAPLEPKKDTAETAHERDPVLLRPVPVPGCDCIGCKRAKSLL